MCWKETKCDIFSIKFLQAYLVRGESGLPLIKIVWNPWVPTKAGPFTQEIVWGKIVMIDQPKRVGQIMSIKHYLCKQEEESSDRLLIHCVKASMLWHLIFSLFGVTWVMHSMVKENLLSWHGSFVGKKHKKAWMVAPLYLF